MSNCGSRQESLTSTVDSASKTARDCFRSRCTSKSLTRQRTKRPMKKAKEISICTQKISFELRLTIFCLCVFYMGMHMVLSKIRCENLHNTTAQLSTNRLEIEGREVLILGVWFSSFKDGTHL
jgi:hypothetical protein